MSRTRSEFMLCIKLLLVLGIAGTVVAQAGSRNDAHSSFRLLRSAANTGAVVEEDTPLRQKLKWNKSFQRSSLSRQAECHSCRADEENANRTHLIVSPQIPDHAPFSPDTDSDVKTTPWKNDDNCKQYRVRLAKQIPLMYLVSYPRSGSSWLRYLIEGATGFFTGSVYRDERLYALEYLGEYESPTAEVCLFIKDHQYRPRILNSLRPVLLVIRDPRDVLMSFFAFRNAPNGSDSFNYTATKEEYRRQDFHEKLPMRIKLWEKMATELITKSRYLHALYYEYLKANPIVEIRRLLEFLRIPVNEGRLACLTEHIEGYVNRGQPTYEGVYTVAEERSFMDAVKRVSALLVQRGLPPLPYLVLR